MRAVLTGLEFSTTYTVYVHGVDEWNRAETKTLTLTTGPMGTRTNARTTGDRVLLDERPFFPVAVWGQCSDGFGSNIDDGINLFMGAGCGDEPRLADAACRTRVLGCRLARTARSKAAA